MKNSQKGFLKALIIIICAVIVIGIVAIALISLQTRQALNEARNPAPVSSNPATSNNPQDQAYVYNNVGKYVIDLHTLAQASFNGKDYSLVLKSNNTSMTNGSGIISAGFTMPGSKQTPGQVLTNVTSNGGTIFVITNTGPTAYAVFGQIPGDPTKYYCVDSTGKSDHAVSLSIARTTCD